MILSAQRVQDPGTRRIGINCTHYQQEPGLLVSSTPLERLALEGQLVWHHRQLETPGNRVLSFIDIVAPEDVSAQDLSEALIRLLALPELQQSFVPWGSRVGFSLGMTSARLPSWRQELYELVTQLFGVLP